MQLPGTLDGASSSAGLTTLIGSLLFLLPLLIWYRYSHRIASNGGLYTFVEAAVGPSVARIQAAFWIISYFLYLVYTVPFIVYYVLPVVFPQLSNDQLVLDAVISVAVVALMLSPLLVIVSFMTLLAIAQVVLALSLAGVSLFHFGLPVGSFVGHGNFPSILIGAGKASGLYVCASLPLFLGGEVRGGGRSVQRALGWSFGVVAVVALIAMVPLANATLDVVNADVPGVTIAQTYAGHPFAVVVAIGVALSTAGLIIAEFIALSRLLATMSRRPDRLMLAVTGGAFLIGSGIALIDPQAAYRVLLKPSLIALWISQVIVVAVYPWFVRRRRPIVAADAILAGAASLVMAFGLYFALTTATT
jgi:amino acid transporter